MEIRVKVTVLGGNASPTEDEYSFAFPDETSKWFLPSEPLRLAVMKLVKDTAVYHLARCDERPI